MPSSPGRIRSAVILLLAAAVLACAQSTSQSLGEAARKARAARQKGRAAKLYTNEDLNQLAPGGISVVGKTGQDGTADTPGAQTGAAAAAATTPAARNPAGIREQISLTEQQLNVLQRELEFERTRAALGDLESQNKAEELEQRIQETQIEMKRLKELLAQSETAKPPSAPLPEGEAAQEKFWRNRFAQVRSKIAVAEEHLQLLQREFELERSRPKAFPGLETDLAATEQGLLITKELNEIRQKIEAKKADLERYKQELANLEDELRRGGGKPAWARP